MSLPEDLLPLLVYDEDEEDEQLLRQHAQQYMASFAGLLEQLPQLCPDLQGLTTVATSGLPPDKDLRVRGEVACTSGTGHSRWRVRVTGTNMMHCAARQPRVSCTSHHCLATCTCWLAGKLCHPTQCMPRRQLNASAEPDFALHPHHGPPLPHASSHVPCCHRAGWTLGSSAPPWRR